MDYREQQRFANEIKIVNSANSINRERIDAAMSGDALRYFLACNRGGFDPEEEYADLYFRGYEEYSQKESVALNRVRGGIKEHPNHSRLYLSKIDSHVRESVNRGLESRTVSPINIKETLKNAGFNY